jgi:hypothetical protein
MKPEPNIDLHEPLERPAQVKTAVTMLYCVLALGLTNGSMFFLRVIETTPLSVFILIALITAAVALILIYQIGKGSNWARITYLIVFLASLPFGAIPLYRLLSYNPVPGTIAVVQTLMQVIALTLLFRQPSSDWFKQVKQRR